MSQDSEYELYLIKRELQGIIEELGNISSGVRQSFSGVGNEKCAECLSMAQKHYTDVKKQLDKVDTKVLSDEYIAMNGPKAKANALPKNGSGGNSR